MKYIIEHMDRMGDTKYTQIIKEKDIPKRLLELGLQWTTKECVDIDGGIDKSKVCLLDPAAETDLTPQDKSKFDYFVFGGILGSHPRIDRTGLLREKYGFSGRRLGSLQMTTDTAIRTTQRIIENGVAFEDIKFLDYPEIKYNKYESTEMPFRYVTDNEGNPILPEGMLELIKNDAEQSIDDLLIE